MSIIFLIDVDTRILSKKLQQCSVCFSFVYVYFHSQDKLMFKRKTAIFPVHKDA